MAKSKSSPLRSLSASGFRPRDSSSLSFARSAPKHGNQPKSLTAAGLNLGKSAGALPSSGMSGSAYSVNDYWEFFKRSSIVNYYATYVSNSASRGVLIIEKLDKSTNAWVMETPESEPRANFILNSLTAPVGGQNELIRRIVMQLSIAGLAQVLIVSDQGGQRVEILSELEAWKDAEGNVHRKVQGGKGGSGSRGKPEILQGADLFSISLPDPMDSSKPLRPLEPVGPILTTYDALMQSVEAAAYSRAGSINILAIPEGMDLMPAGGGIDEQEVDNPDATSMATELGLAMGARIQNPADPANLAPFVVTGPDDLIKEMKVLELTGDQDKQASALRSEMIDALASGLGVSKEVLLGMGSSSNYTASTLIDTNTLSVHILPYLDLIAASLTAGILQPALVADKRADASLYRINYDHKRLLRENIGEDIVRRSYAAGILTLNETRQRLGLPDIENGDQTHFDLNGYRAEQAAAAEYREQDSAGGKDNG